MTFCPWIRIHDQHIFTDPDPGSLNAADPTDPDSDPKHCFFLYPGWGKQILVPNLDGMTPIEIAERAGFSDLASILRYCQE